MLPPTDSVTITSPDFGFSISTVIFSSRSYGFRRWAAAGDRRGARDLREGAFDRLVRDAADFFFAAAFRVDANLLLDGLAFFFAGVFLVACFVAMTSPL